LIRYFVFKFTGFVQLANTLKHDRERT